MKKTASIFISSAIILTGTVHAAAISKSDITPAHINILKQSIEQGCKYHGHQANSDTAKVDAYCECISSELNKSMTDDDWKEIVIYATENHSDAEKEKYVFDRIIPKTAACVK